MWPYWSHALLHILVTKVICRDVEVISTKVTYWQLSKQTTASKRYRFIGLKIFNVQALEEDLTVDMNR